MHFTLATIIACAAALTAAHGHGHEMWKKDITCPTAGGTATFSHPCPTGSVVKHPHSKASASMEHTESKKWDGTVTVFPSGAPETTVIPGIDCQGETGPSCSFITFASATCSETGEHHKKTHTRFPTVTATVGAVKTVHAKHTATCKPAATTAA